MQLEHKAASAALAAGGVIDSGDRYTHTIIGSVTGIVDQVGDVIEPGAYSDTLRTRKPKIIKDHDWSHRLGKCLEVRELLPGDAGLPATTADGKPWPTQAGALVAKVQLFEGTKDGDEAAVRWNAEQDQQQFSIGYVVPKGQARRDPKTGYRHIKSLVLPEISDVLWGAMPLAGIVPEQLASKALELVADDMPDAEDAGPDGAPETDADLDVPAGDGPAGAVADGAGEESLFDDDPASEDSEDADEEDDELVPVDDEDLDAAEPVAAAAVESLGDDPDGAPADGAGDVGAAEVDEAKVMAHLPWDLDVGRTFTPSQRLDLARQGMAQPDGSLPVQSLPDLRHAVQSKSLDDAGRSHLVTRARALGRVDLLPDGWEAKYDVSPLGKPGNKPNWVDKVGGLPLFIRAIAHALVRNGHSTSRAIAIAVGTVKRWSAGGGNVTEKTRAKAAKALAEWEAKRGAAHAKAAPEAPSMAVWDPFAEVGPGAAHVAHPEVKSLRPAGCIEDVLEAIFVAVSAVLNPPRPRTDDAEPGELATPSSSFYVRVEGTWPDRVVATRSDYSLPGDSQEAFEFPYTISEDGTVVLGDPEPVELVVSVVDGSDGSDTVTAEVADAVDGAVGVAQKVLTAATEVKAGRVLSGANAVRIRSALETLVQVLASAGISLEGKPAAGKPPVDEAATETKDDAQMLDVDPAALVAQLRAEATAT